MRRFILACAIVIVFLLPLATVGLARPVVGSPLRSSAPGNRTEIQDQRAKRIVERIELIIARFNNNKERHIAAYNLLKDKIRAAITKLEAQGYDVAKLETDLQSLDGMVVKFAQDYASFISLLQAAEQYAPYESQGQFKAAIQQARAQLRVVRQDNLGIRNFYQTVIRPDIQAVRNQKRQSSAPASSTP